MTPAPDTVEPEMSFEAVRGRLLGNGVRHLPVVVDGLLLGIVSRTDLLRRGKTVAAIMSRDVVTCAPGEPIEIAAARMADRRVRCLPVVEGDELVGILTTDDMLEAVIALGRGRGTWARSASGQRAFSAR